MKFILTAAVLLAAVPIYAGTVVSMTVGNVKILPQGAAEWQAARSGFAVRSGDTIKTGDSSFAELSSDGTIIRVQPSSTVKLGQTLVQDKPQGSLSLFFGSVRCMMKKLRKSGGGYHITTASSVCAVRGTEFDVFASADGNTLLQVTEGAVSFEGLSDSVLVAANQESSAAIGKNPEPVKVIRKQEWKTWADRASSSVKGNEPAIIEGCLAKMKKLDADIAQLESERKTASQDADELFKKSRQARGEGKKKEADNFAGEAERRHTVASSKQSMAFYQASRMDLVLNVADNAYASADDKNAVTKSYSEIQSIHSRHFETYIKPILDAAAKRQEIRNRKKK